MSSSAAFSTPPSAAATAPRERGWWRLLAAVLVALAVPLVAQLRVTVPVEQTMVLIGPAMAACALAAWARGGRFWLFGAWGLLALWILGTRVPGAPLFDTLVRGWTLLLSGAFALVLIVGRSRPFFPRALIAVGLSTVVATIVLLASGVELVDVGRTIAGESYRRLDAVTRLFESRAGTEEWQSLVRRFPAAAAIVDRGEAQLPKLAETAITLFPALLALESLAILALSWALYHRSSRTRIGPPLSRLSEFRFNDQLVWGLILGATLAVLPALEDMRRTGLNVIVFFGALYALRGLGVLSWFLAPGKPTPIWLVLAAVVAGPVVGVFALGLGLVDTWIDWRARIRPAT